ALPRLEGGERLQRLVACGFDERSHRGARILRVADAQRLHRIDELPAEAFRPARRTDEDHEARGRTLLACVAESAAHDIRNSEVEVGARRDDDRILATGLGEQRQIWPPGAEQSC